MIAAIAIALSSLFISQSANSFAPSTLLHFHSARQNQRTHLRAVELKPEPEGGDELQRVTSSLPGSRLKNLGPDIEGEEGVYKFWLTAKADGKEIKRLRDQTEREASKKANFPGFRKGQVPPYAQPQMTGFAVQEAIIKTCEQSLEAYGLESLPGSAGEVTVHEDIKDLVKGYKLGSDVAFTASYRGKFDAAVHAAFGSLPDESSKKDVVVDVEAKQDIEAVVD